MVTSHDVASATERQRDTSACIRWHQAFALVPVWRAPFTRPHLDAARVGGGATLRRGQVRHVLPRLPPLLLTDGY